MLKPVQHDAVTREGLSGMSVDEVEGIYGEDGEIELARIPQGIKGGTRVIVTFLDLEETDEAMPDPELSDQR